MARVRHGRRRRAGAVGRVLRSPRLPAGLAGRAPPRRPALGWVAVGVLALSPFALRYGTETRMYSLVMLLVLAGYLLLDDVARRGRTACPAGRLGLVVGRCCCSPTTGRCGCSAPSAGAGSGAGGATSRPDAPAGRGPGVRGHRRRRPALPAVAADVPATSRRTPARRGPAPRPSSILPSRSADFGGGGFRTPSFARRGRCSCSSLLGAVRASAVDRRHIDLDLRHGAAVPVRGRSSWCSRWHRRRRGLGRAGSAFASALRGGVLPARSCCSWPGASPASRSAGAGRGASPSCSPCA